MKEDLEHILEELESKDQERFLRALEMAQYAHKGQLRKSGRKYITHPIAVTKVLWDKYHDLDLCIAGLLHDTVEDCEDMFIEQVYEEFGEEIGFLVDSANKHECGFHKHDTVIQDKVERLLWAGIHDVRVFLLKLADREHNIKTLDYLKDDKQVRLAFETQAIFAPLKNILGYDEDITIDEMRDRCFRCLKENGVHTPAELKKFLYSMSFKELSEEMYDLVYDNSDKVVWEVRDKRYFEQLTRDTGFEGKARIESMWSDGDSFKATFTFDKGYIASTDANLKVVSYKN